MDGPVGAAAKEHFADKVRSTLAAATDQELLAEWMKTTWESGDPQMDAMAADIERRRLDF